MVSEGYMGLKIKGLLFSMIVTIAISGCSSTNVEDVSKKQIVQEEAVKMTNLVEDRRVYTQYQQEELVTFYVTILKNKEDPLNFYELSHFYDDGDYSRESPKLEAIVQEGNAEGPKIGELGYGMKIANSTIEVRGNTSKLASQKSFKLKLADNAGLWHGQKIFNLNKHAYDFTRVRNKISFDFFKEIPNFTSLQTQFVHLYVKDLTSNDNKYVDYGLFTQIEQPNKQFLYMHGLDSSGNLYKANFFQFYRYPNELKLATDPTYNHDKFETILQIKGAEQHDELLKMLDAVNDYNNNINIIVDKYFDRENYLTWLAVNLLVGNIDTETQNFYLYNPLNSEKFYFLPWDYDAAWGQQDEGTQKSKGITAKFQLGLSNYWGSVLHERFFKDPKNVKDLSAKIEQLSTVFSKQKIKELLQKYYPIVHSSVTKPPDRDRMPLKIENFDKVYNSLADIPEQNKKIYLENLENPMPIYLGEPVKENGFWEFEWDASYDLQGDDLTYEFQVSQFIDFRSLYMDKKNISNTTIKLRANELKIGVNYWRVIVKDAKGYTQIAFDRIEGEKSSFYNGIKKVFIE